VSGCQLAHREQVHETLHPGGRIDFEVRGVLAVSEGNGEVDCWRIGYGDVATEGVVEGRGGGYLYTRAVLHRQALWGVVVPDAIPVEREVQARSALAYTPRVLVRDASQLGVRPDPELDDVEVVISAKTDGEAGGLDR